MCSICYSVTNGKLDNMTKYVGKTVLHKGVKNCFKDESVEEGIVDMEVKVQTDLNKDQT